MCSNTTFFPVAIQGKLMASFLSNVLTLIDTKPDNAPLAARSSEQHMQGGVDIEDDPCVYRAQHATVREMQRAGCLCTT
jgi:hypothetical protein